MPVTTRKKAFIFPINLHLSLFAESGNIPRFNTFSGTSLQISPKNDTWDSFRFGISENRHTCAFFRSVIWSYLVSFQPFLKLHSNMTMESRGFVKSWLVLPESFLLVARSHFKVRNVGGKVTWKLKMMVLKRNLFFNGSIFGWNILVLGSVHSKNRFEPLASWWDDVCFNQFEPPYHWIQSDYHYMEVALWDLSEKLVMKNIHRVSWLKPQHLQADDASCQLGKPSCFQSSGCSSWG